jgi:hypothetical protein
VNSNGVCGNDELSLTDVGSLSVESKLLVFDIVVLIAAVVGGRNILRNLRIIMRSPMMAVKVDLMRTTILDE